MAQRIKKGDRVFVNSGKDSGKIGEVMKIQGLKAIVKDVNVSKKHQKQDQNSQGGIVNKEMPIAIDMKILRSNLLIFTFLIFVKYLLDPFHCTIKFLQPKHS